MTTKCITRFSTTDFGSSWMENLRPFSNSMSTHSLGKEVPTGWLLPEKNSPKRYSFDESESVPLGPWNLEMAPLSSITPDENTQYYPDRCNPVNEKKIKTTPQLQLKRSPSTSWLPTNGSKNARLRLPRSYSASDSNLAASEVKQSRLRLVSVPTIQEGASSTQKDSDEDGSFFSAIFPEEKTAASHLRSSQELLGKSNIHTIQNVLDFSLQDYYGGLSEMMANITVSSPTPGTSCDSSEVTTPTPESSLLDTAPKTAKSSPELVKSDVGNFTPNTYSRKVFIGGLPPDLDADDIKRHFICFGDLIVDWPHKARTRALFPPKGYAFLMFRQEVSVHRLLQACLSQEDKYFVFLSSTSLKDKKVQVRPWFISDSEYLSSPGLSPDPRKTVFIGGVPRPMRASELADVMNERFGSVCYAAIDLDTDVNYPKGAGRVSFTSTNSFINAVSSRFFQLTYGDVNKGVEVKPYVMEDQMCDECHGVQCNGKYAPFYCGSVSCLQYYCDHCWATVHALPSKQNHRPLTKDTADRPRAMPFRGHFS